MSAAPERPPARVLLIDDQPLIGEAVRRLIAGEADLTFHYCRDANRALDAAKEFRPTVILQDLVMPEIDGLTLVERFRADDATREVPMIVLSTKEEPAVKAEAFARGANDYLVKLPDKLELQARLRYHSRGYLNLVQRNEAYRELAESREALAEQLAQAAKYVESLLPTPLGPPSDLRTDWRFIPSAALGGDSFGYHWLDRDRFAFYLLDVCGHGVGAALLSVSAINALRTHSLPDADFSDPGQVLTSLNNVFQMEFHNQMFFTIWYGVYDRAAGELRYSGGGHPPAILYEPGTAPRLLDSDGLMIGAVPGMPFETQRLPVATGSSVLVYSDGIVEIEQADGSMWTYAQFAEFVRQAPADGSSNLDRLIEHGRELLGRNQFLDDVSVLEVRWGG